MLSSPAIDALVAGKELVPWIAPGVLNARRGFYATPNVVRALSLPWARLPGKTPELSMALQQEMRDVIALWQSGGMLVAPNQLKPLRPPPSDAQSVWTLRAADVYPGVRTFGVVPERNIFVATGVVPRDILEEPGSAQWNTSIGVALAMGKKWFAMPGLIKFPPMRRFRQDDLGVVCDEY